jgi:hypothetical protein
MSTLKLFGEFNSDVYQSIINPTLHVAQIEISQNW